MSKIVDWDRHIGRHLKLRDLHIFFRVVQLGSMAKAAAHFRVTQPAVSQVIADLEHALGAKLLDRSPRGVEPTVYGHALLKGGAAAFDELKQTIREIEFLSESPSGEIRIGCPETIAAILPPIIESLSQRYPGIALHVTDVVAPTLDLPQIRDRSLDVALVRITGAPARHRFGDDLDIEVLFNDETLVVADAESPWARRRKIDLAELADEHWVLPPASTTNGMVVMEAFRARGLKPPKVSLVTFSVTLRTNLLTSGRHLTVFPRSMMNLYAARMSLKVLPVKLPAPQWPTVMVTLKNRTLSPAVKLFVDQVRTQFASLDARAPQPPRG
ncbi:MAG: LysR family transcriptional regulator [Alphaproteobacteria bacterium]|nr:MAG: LysR family transcriptional regulator [Alphaproteobacteria bacterium]